MTDQTESITILKPGPPAIVETLNPVVKAAQSFVIVDEDSHAEALTRIKNLRLGERSITEHFEPSRKAIDLAKKAVLEARDTFVNALAMARHVYDTKAQAFEYQQREIARKAEEEAREAARKAEEERAIAEAMELEEAGDEEGAAAVLEAPPLPPPVVHVAPEIAKVEGVSSQTRWSARVDDAAAFVAWLGQHAREQPGMVERAAAACMPDLNRLATSQREAMRVPGVTAVATSRTAVRG